MTNVVSVRILKTRAIIVDTIRPLQYLLRYISREVELPSQSGGRANQAAKILIPKSNSSIQIPIAPNAIAKGNRIRIINNLINFLNITAQR